MVSGDKRDYMTQNRCPHCGSDLVLTRGHGRVATLGAITVAVPPELQLLRCHGCRRAYPTPAQLSELREAPERGSAGDGARGHRAPLRRT